MGMLLFRRPALSSLANDAIAQGANLRRFNFYNITDLEKEVEIDRCCVGVALRCVRRRPGPRTTGDHIAWHKRVVLRQVGDVFDERVDHLIGVVILALSGRSLR